MLQPLFNRIIFIPEIEKDRTKAGLYLPPTAQGNSDYLTGIVESAGPGRYENGILIPTQIKAGDKILIGKVSCVEIKLKEKKFMICRESDIIGIIND